MERLDDVMEDLADLVLGAAHQDRVFERVLGKLPDFVNVLIQNFKFLDTGNRLAFRRAPNCVAALSRSAFHDLSFMARCSLPLRCPCPCQTPVEALGWIPLVAQCGFADSSGSVEGVSSFTSFLI